MEFINHTPFAGNAWDTVNSLNQWHCTNVARVRFRLRPSEQYSSAHPEWVWQLHPDQGELFSEDVFHQDNVAKIYQQTGDAELAAVRYESDYVGYKPSTDIVFNAKAYAPEGIPVKSWQCGVNVYESSMAMAANQSTNSLSLLAQGPVDTLLRKKVTSIPIRYEYSVGGITHIKNKGKKGESISLDTYNPIGVGKDIMSQPLGTNDPLPLPSVQIGYTDPQAIPNPQAPAGLGIINRGWRSRLAYAGTYDEKWLSEQHPLPPHDFDQRHHQAAHPSLVTKGYIQAGACLEWLNLLPDESRGYCVVPNYRLLSRIQTDLDTLHAVMNLDTIIIDIDDEDPESFNVYASWRSYSPLITSATRSEVMLMPENALSNSSESVRSEYKERV
jgi:hypothetical protein